MAVAGLGPAFDRPISGPIKTDTPWGLFLPQKGPKMVLKSTEVDPRACTERVLCAWTGPQRPMFGMNLPCDPSRNGQTSNYTTRSFGTGRTRKGPLGAT